MYMPPDTRLKLDPRDDYTHAPEAAAREQRILFTSPYLTPRFGFEQAGTLVAAVGRFRV